MIVKHPGLRRRRGIFEYRKAFPKDLVAQLGKTKWIVPLGARNESEAIHLYLKVKSEIDGFTMAARLRPRTDGHVLVTLASRWLAMKIAEFNATKKEAGMTFRRHTAE